MDSAGFPWSGHPGAVRPIDRAPANQPLGRGGHPDEREWTTGGPRGRRPEPASRAGPGWLAGYRFKMTCKMMITRAKNVTPSMRAAAMIMAVWMFPAISG